MKKFRGKLTHTLNPLYTYKKITLEEWHLNNPGVNASKSEGQRSRPNSTKKARMQIFTLEYNEMTTYFGLFESYD